MTKLKDYLLITLFTGIALIIGLIEKIAGKSFEDDWHDLYDRGSLNGGQGPERKNKNE